MKWKEIAVHAGATFIVLVVVLTILESPQAQAVPGVSFLTHPFGVG